MIHLIDLFRRYSCMVEPHPKLPSMYPLLCTSLWRDKNLAQMSNRDLRALFTIPILQYLLTLLFALPSRGATNADFGWNPAGTFQFKTDIVPRFCNPLKYSWHEIVHEVSVFITENSAIYMRKQAQIGYHKTACAPLPLPPSRSNNDGDWLDKPVQSNLRFLKLQSVMNEKFTLPNRYQHLENVSNVWWVIALWHVQRLQVIWRYCCLRVAARPSLPNGLITQLRLYLTQNPCSMYRVGEWNVTRIWINQLFGPD